MIKYTQKTSLLFILFFSSLLLKCTSENKMVIRTCSTIGKNSDCDVLISSMVKNINHAHNPFSMTAKPSFVSDYANMISLSNHKADFAFLAYDLLTANPKYNDYLKEIIPIQKSFFKPVFAVVAKNSPYYTLADLKDKNIGINKYYDKNRILQDLLKNQVKTYRAIEIDMLDFPALLNDKALDMFLCFSVDCKDIFQKTNKIHGELRILPIKKYQNSEQFNNIVLRTSMDISSYEGISNKNKNITTIGIWEYLVARKGTPEPQIQAVSEAFNKTLETYTFNLPIQENLILAHS